VIRREFIAFLNKKAPPCRGGRHSGARQYSQLGGGASSCKTTRRCVSWFRFDSAAAEEKDQGPVATLAFGAQEDCPPTRGGITQQIHYAGGDYRRQERYATLPGPDGPGGGAACSHPGKPLR
jgi:hypothetical protein